MQAAAVQKAAGNRRGKRTCLNGLFYFVCQLIKTQNKIAVYGCQKPTAQGTTRNGVAMNTTKQLYQWDINQMLVDCTGLYVDFPVNGEIYRVETKDGECLIPDEFLQVEGRQKIWECMPDCTRKEFVLEIKARPMPPDYAFTPTEKLTFDGLVKRVDDAIADMIRRADSGEFDGYTPVKGKDYFTADEIKQIQDEVSSGAVGDFKSVVDTETETFNINAETKLNEFNVNAESNLTEYNGNATEKLNAYNSNAETKVTEYNQNDTNKTAEYNSNAETKIDEYNTNANNRVAEFDSHTEQIQTDISGLKNDLTNVNNTKADKSELVKTNFYLDALWKLNNGISYQYETDDTTAYQKTVPSGAKLCGLQKIGGRTLVWNQIIDYTTLKNGTFDGNKFTSDKPIGHYSYMYLTFNQIAGHKYYFKVCNAYYIPTEGTESSSDDLPKIMTYSDIELLFSSVKLSETPRDYGIFSNIATVDGTNRLELRHSVYGFDRQTTIYAENIIGFDLTQMFGSGNEPATVEEFEAMFPLDYYPYNAGELMSFPMNEMVNADASGVEISIPTPQAILDLDGYGESAGNVYNCVNCERKEYTKRVSKIEITQNLINLLTNQNSQYDNDSSFMVSTVGLPKISQYANGTYRAFTCNNFNESKSSVQYSGVEGCWLMSSHSNVKYSNVIYFRLPYTIKDGLSNDSTAAEKEAAAKEWFTNNPTIFHTEVEEEIIDISDLLDDEPFEVEAGGSLTFRNSNGDGYRVPIPTEEKYIVSLAEVTA